MKKIVYGLVGASGFGAEVMPLLKENITASKNTDLEIIFIDSDESMKEVNGIKVVSEKVFFNLDADEKYFNVAIADPKTRQKVVKNFKKNDVNPFSIFSADYQALKNINFSEGAIVCPYSLFTSDISIGRFFHCNYKSAVAHNCTIGDFVTLAPGVLVNGNISVGNCAYIGAGALIKQGISIGENSTIGMGSVVLKDVLPGTTVVGNPARELKN